MKIYNGDILVLDVEVNDDSYRYRAVMGENTLVLKFSLPQHVEIPVGSYCEFREETYTLIKPENLKMNHTRSFEYTIEMHSSQSSLSKYKFRNIVDRRLKFSLTARPEEHLQMLVDNLNARESGWTIGECVDSPEKVISYNHTYLLDALEQMAETFGTEWEISGKTISLHKVEYNKENPLALDYGKGHGFKPGVGRTNFEDSVPTEILYTQGGNRNIDASKYGNSELLLPKSKTIRFDGTYFEDEVGFDASRARTYVTDADGYSIRRQDKELKTNAEDSLDCSEIYPHRDEKILKVIVVDKEENWYDVVTDAPETLDYSQYSIGGERATIKFQSGMLAGREFEVETDKEGNIICEKYYNVGSFLGWKFQIIPAEQDGITMPGESYLPAVDDVFRFFGIQLPDAYIEEDATKSGASWEMFREGVKCLYNKEDEKFTFTGTLDGIWTKQNWIIIGGNEKIRIGGFVAFTNEQIQPEPVLIRITGIKDYVNNPYSPEIELSNSTKGISVSSELNKIASNEERTDGLFRDSVNFTKRRFRDAKETISMLEEAMLTGFTDSISPLTVQTMMMLVGDQSLQFRFVDSKTNPQQVVHNVEYDDSTKILSIDGGTIQHMTLGIDSVSSGHGASEYKFWTLPAFDSPILNDITKKYYIYAKVSRTDETGSFYMSETAKSMESESGYYYLLVGLLNSEYDGTRSYVSLYGFTEILPGQITTDVIRDTGGNLIIDLVNRLITVKNGARIDGNISIGSGSSGLENLSEWSGKQQQISNAQDSANSAQSTANTALQAAQDAKDFIDNTLPGEIAEINAKIDGVVENWFYDYTPTRSNEPAATWIKDGTEKDHVGDTFTNTQEYVNDETTPDAGKSWRWVASGSSYAWTPIADSDAVKALQQAAKAQDTADEKRRVFVTTPHTPYDVGDMWVQGSTGDIMRCIKARSTGSYTSSDWDKASKYTDDTAAQAAQDAADAAKAAAQTAQNTANEAKSDAADANTQLSSLMADNIITPPEKTSLKQQHSDIKAEYAQIIADAQKYSVSTTAYASAYSKANSALTKYTASSPQNITVGSDYSNIYAYYTARQTILDTIAAAAKKVATDAQETADEAKSKAQNALDTIENLKVGGRNLLLGSNQKINSDGYPSAKYNLTEQIKEGTTCSISIKGSLGTGKNRWGIYNSGGSVNMTELTEADKDENGIYRKTFTWRISSADNTYVSIYPMPQMSGNEPESSIEWVMLEYGNIPGSWSLAPEDVEQTFDSIVNFTNEAFSDGVISRSEAVSIEKYINNIKEIQKSAEGTYTTIYNNEDLIGTAKTSLSSIYGALVSETNSLITVINNIIATGVVTDENKQTIDNYYDRVNSRLQSFNEAVETATTVIQERMKMKAILLASATAGNMLYTDPEFKEGVNSIAYYKRYGSSATVTLTRKSIPGTPNTSGYGIEMVCPNGEGGFRFGTATRANRMLVCRFVAKIPAGRQVMFATNSLGDNNTSIWLTSDLGTGEWEEYAYYVKAGNAGTFSTTFFFYIKGTEAVTWQLAYATVFDLAADNTRISDLQYLKDVFGYVVDVNGVVLGKLIAVKDENNEVKAIMNGSDLGKDSEHGKLLIAGGISNIEQPKNAVTKIYEDGHIETSSAKIIGSLYATKGKVGKLYIDQNMGLIMDPGNELDNYTAFQLDNSNLGFEMEYGNLRTAFTVGDGNYVKGSVYDDESGESVQTHDLMYTPGVYVMLHMKHNNDSLSYYRESAALTIKATQEESEDARGCITFAIKCLDGMIAGLRPYAKTISASYVLSYLDHTIIVDAASNITLTLPSAGTTTWFGAQTLQFGQEYLLVFNGGPGETGTIVLKSTSANIHMPLDDKWSVSSINLTRKGMVKIIYAPDKSGNGRWWVTRLAG